MCDFFLSILMNDFNNFCTLTTLTNLLIKFINIKYIKSLSIRF